MPTQMHLSCTVTLSDGDEFEVAEEKLKLRDPWKAFLAALTEAKLEYTATSEAQHDERAAKPRQARAATDANGEPRVKRTWTRRTPVANGASSLKQQTPVEPLPTSLPASTAAE